jgi:hypothetical protein
MWDGRRSFARVGVADEEAVGAGGGAGGVEAQEEHRPHRHAHQQRGPAPHQPTRRRGPHGERADVANRNLEFGDSLESHGQIPTFAAYV